MRTKRYPAHGWLPANAHFQLEWDDQGRDFATNWNGVVQAPGDGECIAILSDQAFPSGFGPHYPVVRITTGAWAGHDYYIGHTTAVVKAGEKFGFGHPLSRADQGHNWAGTTGGWVELGEAFNGGPGPKADHHWYDSLIATDLVLNIPDSPLSYGMKGLRIMGLSSCLRDCGYLKRPYWHFDSHVHGAVVAFKTQHRIPMPPIAKDPKKQKDRGVVDDRCAAAIKHASDWCKKHHTKEYPPKKQ